MANKWLMVDCGAHQPMVVAPAELALAWPGATPTGRYDVYLTYFQPLMSELKKTHPELVWEGDKDTPFVKVGSESEAKAVIAKLTDFGKAKDPAMKTKKQKSIMQFRSGDSWRLATLVPETASDAALEAARTSDALTWDVGGKPVLLWSPTVQYYGVRVRTDDDGFTLLDTEADESTFDDLVEGKAKALGTWEFAKGIGVVNWAGISIRECKGLEKAKVSDLAALVAKKPAVLAKPTDKEAGGGAAVLKIAPGAYRAETGGDNKARWLRFSRA